ncbi:MAG: hypothetical protein LBQ15_06625 [Clostridium sp.]|jgi:hypothetical protein|nr:hypothetical protein [Clostridium sp.]
MARRGHKNRRILLFGENLLFPAVLLLYSLRHIRVGVEWWDTGYNYGNFTYMERMDPMWMFGTYLGNALGRVFTRLPFGGCMLGLNVYTGLLVGLLAVAGYFFFAKKVGIAAWLSFAGELLALSLCWCPTALLYNYLTYALFCAGAVFLYLGLTGKSGNRGGRGYSPRRLVLAGLLLGMNLFVRFPNLTEAALILAVWVYGAAKRPGATEARSERIRPLRGEARFPWRVTTAQTLWCILGYGIGAGGCLGYLAVRYGLGAYMAAILRLLRMPAEASGYTPLSMIVSQVQNYHQNLIWLGRLAALVLAGLLGFAVLPGRLLRVKKLGFVAAVFLFFYYLMQRDMFNLKYSTKMSVFQWAVFLLTGTLLAGTVTLLRAKARPEEKLMAVLAILVILLTPLGSNNHLYSSINNLFLVAPFTLWMIFRFLAWLPAETVVARFRLCFFPVKAMVGAMLFLLAVQGLGFGFGYVFSESDGGENLHTKIENNAILKGMYTSADRAGVLASLSAYVEGNGWKGREVILYGQIPALSYYLELPFAITAWPDLGSYQYETMEADLDGIRGEVSEKGRELPLLLLERRYGESLIPAGKTARDGEAGQAQPAPLEEAVAADRKFALLREWAREYRYEAVFWNEKFVLLEPLEGGVHDQF